MVTLNPIFTNGMIMQAGKPVRIFGSGDGTVSVEFFGITKSASATGEWMIEYEAQNYGGPHTLKITLDGVTTEITDVYFGDVYLLGGQSNMQFKMWERREPTDVYEGNENVRLFTVDRIEENVAVCMDENEVITNLNVADLPFEVREGTVIVVNDDGSIEHDSESEEKRREKLFALQESLFDE